MKHPSARRVLIRGGRPLGQNNAQSNAHDDAYDLPTVADILIEDGVIAAIAPAFVGPGRQGRPAPSSMATTGLSCRAS